jgi:hypothetical protein
LTVNPPVCVSAVSLSANTVDGGQDVTGAITLNGPAPSGGVVVRLQSSDSHVTVPATVTVAQGQATATFKIGTKRVDSSLNVTVSASADGCGSSATLIVN